MGHKSAKSLNIKKGDTVKVIAGKDKGAEGKVIAVNRETGRVVVIPRWWFLLDREDLLRQLKYQLHPLILGVEQTYA